MPPGRFVFSDRDQLREMRVYDILPALYFIGLASAGFISLEGLGGLAFLSRLMVVSHMALAGALFIVRRTPSATSHHPVDVVVFLVASTAMNLFNPILNQDQGMAGLFLVFAGWLVAFVGVAALNRSFAILPGNRGIMRGWPYSMVRHPIYLGYQVLMCGYFINNASAYNAALLVVFSLSSVIRVLREERFLSDDPEYVGYSAAVRWRLVPGIW